MKIRVLDIVRGTTVDGPGFRTAIYMAGCRHECPGCHNPESWSFDSGYSMTIEEILAVVEEEDFDVTLTGGDPLYHPHETQALVKGITSLGHTTWIYTGFTMEQIYANPELREAIKGAEVIVDGPFVEVLHDPDLLFRGSSNQKINYLDPSS